MAETRSTPTSSLPGSVALGQDGGADAAAPGEASGMFDTPRQTSNHPRPEQDGSTPAAAGVEQQPTEEAAPDDDARGAHRHQIDCHDKAVAAGGEERSLTNLPSASTSVDRVDEEGHSLLHRGGDSGGVYDSMGTMSQMSGINPSGHGAGGGGGGGGIFRPGRGGGGGGTASLEAAGSADSFIRTASAGEDSTGSGGNQDKAGASLRPPMPPRRPKPVTVKSRKVSWGVESVSSDRDSLSGTGEDVGRASAGARGGTANDEESLDRLGILRAGGGFPRDEKPLRGEGSAPGSASHHSRGPSFGEMFRNMAKSVGTLVKSSRNLVSDSPDLGMFKEGRTGEEGDGAGKKGLQLWGNVHRRLDSVILKGQQSESDFDFSKVDLDENDLAQLRAAGVQCEDGKVMETPTEIEERGGTAGKILSIIKKRSKRESLLEKAESIRRKFDVSLKECIIAICVYLALSVAAYSFVFETWPVVDSLYFAVVTFTTIGYGDLTPSTVPGQAFMCFFGLGGVASLGLALGVIGSDIVETRVNAVDSAREEAREFSHREVMHIFDDEDESKSESSETIGLLRTAEGEVSSCVAKCWNPFRSKTARILLPLLAILLSGCIFIAVMEGWSIFTGIYYGIVTSCTIGYGDDSPSLPSTRLFSVFFIPVAVAVMGQILGAFSSYVMEERQKEFKQALHEVDFKSSHLEGMSSAGNGVVTRLDYMEFMLQAMNLVDRELLDELHENFNKLDKTGDGVLTEADLKVMARKKLHGAKKKLELAEYKSTLLRKPAMSGTPEHAAHQNLVEAVESVLV